MAVRHSIRLFAAFAGALAALPAAAAESPPAVEPTTAQICPPLTAKMDALKPLMERFLTPGETFSLSGISPDQMREIAALTKEGAERQAKDWPNLCRYAAENAAVLASGTRPRVVFLGDSITENWKLADPALFGVATLDRGISGQTTPQILLRMMADVIALRPRVVHIMAGTNDISGNTGLAGTRTIVDNLRAMIQLAKANRIEVVLASVTPSSGFSMRAGFNPAARIADLNRRLRQLAADERVVYADYYPLLADDRGGMRAGLANDGLHPNRAGYAVMKPLTERAITMADKQRR